MANCTFSFVHFDGDTYGTAEEFLSFFYTRLAENPEPAKRFSVMRIYRHVLGREAAKDEIVFAPGVGGARDVPDAAFTSIQVPFESRHAYAVVRDGVTSRGACVASVSS